MIFLSLSDVLYSFIVLMAAFITQHILSHMGDANSRPARLCPVTSHITLATVIVMKSALIKQLVLLFCATKMDCKKSDKKVLVICVIVSVLLHV